MSGNSGGRIAWRSELGAPIDAEVRLPPPLASAEDEDANDDANANANANEDAAA